jgi:hypothetical protein
MAAVSFGFVPGLFELPDYAQDKYFNLAVVNLTQLGVQSSCIARPESLS